MVICQKNKNFQTNIWLKNFDLLWQKLWYCGQIYSTMETTLEKNYDTMGTKLWYFDFLCYYRKKHGTLVDYS